MGPCGQGWKMDFWLSHSTCYGDHTLAGNTWCKMPLSVVVTVCMSSCSNVCKWNSNFKTKVQKFEVCTNCWVDFCVMKLTRLKLQFCWHISCHPSSTTYMCHLELAGKSAVDFLLDIIEVYSLAWMMEPYEQKSVKVGIIWMGIGHFEHKLYVR